MLWAALLRAGPGAVLSHETAAERHGLIDGPSPVVMITVPALRHPARTKIPGIVIYRSDAILRTRHPVMERPHGLPAARRQAKIRQDRGNRYLDNLYDEFGVCAEVDGTAAHPADEQWRDKRRDNENNIHGIVTLRFGFPDVSNRCCETAATVAAVLRRRGWPAHPHRCSRPGCEVATS